MNKKLFMLWSFLLCFALGISAEEVTIDFTKKGYTNGQEVATVEQDGITVKFDKGSNSNTPKYYNTGTAVRVYGGGNMIVSSANTITSIALTFGSGDGSNAITTDVGTYSNKTWTGSSTAVKFTVGGASGHKRIKSMVVTYGAAPTIDKPSITGTTPFYGETTVSIDCTTEGAAIYYTTDGTEPTTTSTAYTAPFTLNASATVKAISAKGEDVSAVVSKDFVALTGYATIASVTELANNAQFAFTGDAVVVASPTNYYTYIKDATGYSLIYSANKKFEVGSHITPNWTGKVSIYNNLFEMVPTSTLTTVEGETETITYPEANVAELTAENMNKVVTLKGVTYTQPASGKKEFNIVSGETTIAGYNQFGLTIAAPEAEKTYDIVGAISVYKTNVQFQPISITEAEPAPVAPVWKDIKIDFTNDKVMTSDETNVVSFGIKMNDDATATRVAADDPTANIVITGKYHSTQHGLSNFSATVKVEGPVKIGMGSCAWGGNVTVKDENGVEVANAFNTNNGACWATADGAEKNVIYTYYKGEAATLTIAGGSYTPYFSVEKIALEDIPTVMKVNYSLGETGAAGILPANFEIDGGKTFNTPVNRTLYVEGKTLTGWTDGTNNYTIGQEITAVADTEITLVPVFTDNTVTLADRKEAVTIVWDFQQKNGAPVVAVQGKTMIWVAQAVVNGQTIDVKMDIDATSGKVANGNWQDWCQINPNTKLTIPAAKDAVIGLESYAATTTTTIAGEVINQETTTPSYTYTGEETTVDIVIGDGSYWRTVSINLPVVVVEEPKPTEPVVELTHTASSYCETDANAYVSTVDAEKEHVNNSKFSGTWQGAAYADFSITLPEGHSIKSASLAWAGIGSSKDRTTDIMYVNAGEQLDYTALAAGNAKVNLPATYIATVTFKKSTTTSFTTDVTEAVKAIIESGQNNVIFKFTNNVGAGDLVGKGAAEKAPVLTVETVSADDMTKYTVVAMVDADTVKVVSYDGVVGETATASAEDMAAFKNEDGSKKYIYVGGNSEITLVNDSASNIINLVFREAEKYRYSVVAKNGDGEMMQTLTNGQDFEGETIKVPYSRYILNYSDSTLYAADATNKEYNKSLTINEDGATLNITYKKTEINNVIAFSEAEDVWGLTPITTGNASIRSSQSAAAYAAEEDVEVAYLTTGKYKMAAIIYDASKNLNSTFTFGIANDTILKATSTAANWTECVSDEFTVLGSNVPVVLHKGGSEIRGVDFFFIQKTGGVPAVAVANIAEAKKVKNGTPIKLTLNDAKVTVQTYAMTGTFVALEDASGAIQLSSNMALEGITEQNALNGELYVSFVDQNGAMQLDLSDSTQYSQFTATPSTFTPAEIKYSEVKDSANLYRFVKLGACKTIYDEEMYMYYAISGKDTIPVIDRFMNMQTWMGYATEVPEQVEYMTGVVMHNGEEFCFYPYAYGEDKAIVGVAQPEDIVVNVTEGEISAAVEAEKAKVAKVGNITVNLTAGAAYTIASTIEIPAGFILNGNGATIDASGLGAKMIQAPAGDLAEWATIDSVAVKDVTIKGLARELFYSNAKNRNYVNFVVENSVIELTGDKTTFDFTKGSVAMNFLVKNSTIYAPTATTKSLYSSQSAQKGSDAGATADAPQTFTFENNTLYNLAYNKNLFTHRSASQAWMKYVVKNNVVVNTGKSNFMTTINQGQDNKNPQYDVTVNSVGTLVDGAYTDQSAAQTVQSNVMGTLVATNPGFKDVAAGDFTVYAGSEQAKQKIGDPRWLVEFDETLTGIDGINAAETLNGAVYTINGIKVREAGETLKGLSKGMYIINGKKYVVK